MRIWPKNQTYTSEPLAKTVAAPIILLLFSVGTFLILLNPFIMPSVAQLLGMDQKIYFQVERVEEINPSFRTRSWNCDHWVAYGNYEGRQVYTRACDSQAHQPEIGDILETLAAPSGSEVFLLARGSPNPPPTLVLTFFIALLAAYGIVVSTRLFYIGYKSNWFTSKSPKKS